MRFTLRDLFWLTIVSALGVGWFCDHRWEEKPKPSLICVYPAWRSGDVLNVSNNSVEISLGSDDLVKSGDVFYVTRDNKYIGPITIRKATGPERAVGDIDPKMMRSQIQKGDTVSSELNPR